MGLVTLIRITNALGAIGTFATAFRGRPSVRRGEFDEHKSQVFARLNGLNEKLNAMNDKLEEGQDDIMKELRSLVQTIGRHEGKLEGLGKG